MQIPQALQTRRASRLTGGPPLAAKTGPAGQTPTQPNLGVAPPARARRQSLAISFEDRKVIDAVGRRASMQPGFVLPTLIQPPLPPTGTTYESYLGNFEQKRKQSEAQETPGKPKKQPHHPKFKSELHAILFQFCESGIFSTYILLVILMNTCVLVSQTWQEVAVRFGWYCVAVDTLFLGVYIMESVVKIYVWRKEFFNDGWNVLDLIIVLFGTADFALPLVIQSITAFDGTSIFRLLRIFRTIRAIRALRVLKTIRFLATLQVIMTTLLQSIRSIGAIVMLIGLFMYMFAVVGRGLYSQASPTHFGTIFRSLFTLFQLLTLDDWFDVYQSVSLNSSGNGHIIIYLLLYIVVEYFVFLNLFVAVLVDNFQLTLEAQNEANKRKKLMNTEESDDEEDLLPTQMVNRNRRRGLIFADDVSLSSSGLESEDDDMRQPRKTMADVYPDMPESKRHPLGKYLRLLTSLEFHAELLDNRQQLVNMMVDMCNSLQTDD